MYRYMRVSLSIYIPLDEYYFFLKYIYIYILYHDPEPSAGSDRRPS